MTRLRPGRKHVFLDWSLVEAGYGVAWRGTPRPSFMPYGVRLVAFRPRLHSGPVLFAEHPWENLFINAYATLMADTTPGGRRFRLYYEAYSGYDRGDFSARLCYAESDDGLHWEKPTLGLIPFQGSTDNNIVFADKLTLGRGAHGAFVFRDPHGKPQERYKMVHCANDDKGQIVAGAVSPDGIHWRALEKPVLRYTSDTQTVVIWDEDTEMYRGYFRGWPRDLWPRRRTVDCAATPDFYSWPQPRTCLTTDANDAPDVDIYTNAYIRWPGAQDAHLMFPCFYRRATDLMETHLAVSRDGWVWQRPMRAPLIPAGAPESEQIAGNMAACGLVETMPGEWTMLVGLRMQTHNETHYEPGFTWQGGLWRATIREDGFMAVEADAQGEFWTVPITFAGHRLAINAWTHFGGMIQAGLENESGQPIHGRGLAECDPISGDALWQTVSWKGETDLSGLEDKPLRLHFKLTRGRLHAFRFQK